MPTPTEAVAGASRCAIKYYLDSSPGTQSWSEEWLRSSTVVRRSPVPTTLSHWEGSYWGEFCRLGSEPTLERPNSDPNHGGPTKGFHPCGNSLGQFEVRRDDQNWIWLSLLPLVALPSTFGLQELNEAVSRRLPGRVPGAARHHPSHCVGRDDVICCSGVG